MCVWNSVAYSVAQHCTAVHSCMQGAVLYCTSHGGASEGVQRTEQCTVQCTVHWYSTVCGSTVSKKKQHWERNAVCTVQYSRVATLGKEGGHNTVGLAQHSTAQHTHTHSC